MATINSFAPQTEDTLQQLIRRYRRRSDLALGLAIVLFIVGSFVSRIPSPERHMLGYAFVLIAIPLWFYGCGCYAKAKGHAFAWGAIGFFGFIGLILLPNKYKAPKKTERWARNLIVGLLIFIVMLYAIAVAMSARTKSNAPAPENYRPAASIPIVSSI